MASRSSASAETAGSASGAGLGAPQSVEDRAKIIGVRRHGRHFLVSHFGGVEHVATGARVAAPPVAEVAENRVAQVGKAGPDLVQEARHRAHLDPGHVPADLERPPGHLHIANPPGPSSLAFGDHAYTGGAMARHRETQRNRSRSFDPARYQRVVDLLDLALGEGAPQPPSRNQGHLPRRH